MHPKHIWIKQLQIFQKNVIDLDFYQKNIENLAQYKNKPINHITVCILDRPRHKKIIDELKKLGVNLKLISDGDVAGALLVTNKKYNVDMFLGIGGGPEGVLAASALDAFECFFKVDSFLRQKKIKKEQIKWVLMILKNIISMKL